MPILKKDGTPHTLEDIRKKAEQLESEDPEFREIINSFKSLAREAVIDLICKLLQLFDSYDDFRQAIDDVAELKRNSQKLAKAPESRSESVRDSQPV